MKKAVVKIASASVLVSGLLAAQPAFAGGLIKFGHDNKTDPYENPSHACAAVFSTIVNSQSHGSIEVEVYGTNQLGTAREHVQLVRDGVIQAALVSTGAIASYYPRIDVLNAPFAFRDISSTYPVFDGPFGEALARDIQDHLEDVVVLGFPDTGGFFAITNSKHEATTPEDFKDVRIRTMTLPSHQKIVQAIGAEAYPLAWSEVYTALQTGVIDGQMNPIPIIAFSNFAEVQKHLTLTEHLFSPYIFLLNRSYYDALTDAEKTAVREAASNCVAASRGLSRIIEASDRGLAGLQKKMEVKVLTAEQQKQFADRARPAFLEHIKTNLDQKAQELLEIFNAEVTKANADVYME